MTVLDTIGRTRLILLRRMALQGSAWILLKLEYENPTGSIQDRMARAMIEAAEADGRLRRGGSVVEYTGGSTGVSLAFVCAAKRIPLQIVTSDAFSKEKRDHMAALGARLTLVPSPTGGSLRGITTRLRVHHAAVHAVAVEPDASAVLSGRPSGSHGIEGIGAGFVVPLWNGTLANEIQTMSTEEAMPTARRLAREEGIFAGTSTGGNVAVALRVADRLGPDHTVVTVAVDSGMKYLSTALYSGEPFSGVSRDAGVD